MNNYADMNNSSVQNGAYLNNLAVLGFVGICQQICDNILTYSRYLVLFKNESRCMKIFVGMYLFFLLCTWAPFYLVVPAFSNMNTAKAERVQYYLYDFAFIPGLIAFDLFYTGKFVVVMRKLRTEAVRDNTLILLANKSIIHAIVR